MVGKYGALPLPTLSAELLSLIQRGKVYALSYPMSPKTPHATTTSPLSVSANHRHSDPSDGASFGEATEILTLSSHTATHLEALCHVSEKTDRGPVLFGDIPVAEVEREGGFAKLGIEACPPIFTRGLLLDIPHSKGIDVLPDSYGVTESDLFECSHRFGIDIHPGDGVLIRTGFSRYRDTEQERFSTVGAGPTPSACRWLADQGLSLTGSDTMSYECVPSPHHGHIELIRRRGIPILKQVNLEELATDQIYEFVLIVLPLNLVGATASPVTPVAVC